ncbi:MAG TPA: L-histidine N(alpha)-methyltransferase [Pelomicrobium sp.]|nr:L-histidine N(alpha)-methyltransferase [Pelomicrobium sp.]
MPDFPAAPAADAFRVGPFASVQLASNAVLHDCGPIVDRFLEDAVNGLGATPKSLPPKYFYDAEGSRLFDLICELPEYAVTRTETAMMRGHAPEMAACLGRRCVLIEFGSGSSQKSRLLIEALRPAVYAPIEISRSALEASVRQLAQDYPWLSIEAMWGDYSRPLVLPLSADARALRRVAYFPGSSISNFAPADATAFLARVAALTGSGGGLLIGIDLKKPVDRMTRAYDDSRGVTAAFNRNLLERMNRELGADFDPTGFRHVALYNPADSRIEMHLASIGHQQVRLAGRTISFFPGETLHTENSYKYDLAEFSELARRGGWVMRRQWLADDEGFAVSYLEAGV